MAEQNLEAVTVVFMESGDVGSPEVERTVAHLPRPLPALIAWGDHIWTLRFYQSNLDASRDVRSAEYVPVDVFSVDHSRFLPVLTKLDAEAEAEARLWRHIVGAEDLPKDIERIGEAAFNAYNEAGDRPWQTFDGRPVPRWKEVSADVRAKWKASARFLVGDEVSRRRAAVAALALNTMKQMFSLRDHLRRQAVFSITTFGPGTAAERVAGIVDHISKELVEVSKKPHDLMEWIDIAILAFEGAMRIPGVKGVDVERALVDKQTQNENRQWPDWRTAPKGKAIEHVKSKGELSASEGDPRLPDVEHLLRTVQSAVVERISHQVRSIIGSARMPFSVEAAVGIIEDTELPKINAAGVLATVDTQAFRLGRAEGVSDAAAQLRAVMPEHTRKLTWSAQVEAVQHVFNLLAKAKLRTMVAQQASGGSVDFAFLPLAELDAVLDGVKGGGQ